MSGAFPLSRYYPIDQAIPTAAKRKRKISSIQFPVHSNSEPVLKRHRFIIIQSEKSITREKHSFSGNHTIARKAAEEMLPADSKDRIEDHAFRRVLIFYYLLLIYYREGLTVEVDGTTHQFGIAKQEGHHAAHSSILPNIKDGFAAGRLLPSESHFYRTMNSTVEVVKDVNQCDSLIEGTMRKTAIEIVNRVSKENLHPYEGLNLFVDSMQEFFLESELQILQKLDLVSELAIQEDLCAQHEEWWRSQGTTQSFISYCNGLIAVKELQHRICACSTHSPSLPQRPPLTTHKEIIREIESIIGKEKKKIDKERSLERLKTYAAELKEKLSIQKNPVILLRRVQKATSQKRAVTLLHQFIDTCNKGELYLALGGDEKKLFAILQKKEQWKPESLEEYREKLFMMLDILQTQQKATSLPRYEELSGKYEDGKLVGLSEQELMHQKREIF